MHLYLSAGMYVQFKVWDPALYASSRKKGFRWEN